MSYIGQFCWYDLMTTDVEASTKFFTGLFGWTVGGDDPNYAMWANGENRFGGVAKQDKEGMPSAWNAYIGVTDVDASAAKVEKMGGTIVVPPTDIPNAGRFSVVSDPQGAYFSMFQGDGSEGDKTWSPSRGNHDFEWSELGTSDIEGAKGFYGENFNWAGGQVMDMESGSYHMMMLGETPVCGVFDKPAEAPMSFWTHYVKVEDVDAAVAKAKELGGNVVLPPTTVPDMVTFAVLADPTGAAFGIAKSLSQG